MKIHIIVPPKCGGVTDFAEVLSAALSAEHDVEVIIWSKQMTQSSLDEALDADCVYLQYSGYGYTQRGAPYWLLHALRQRRQRIRRLCVFFHELYAFEAPWSSAFWLSPFQRHIAVSLARLSDAWLTNRHASAHWLLARSSPRPSAVLPVFSNVGEAPVCPTKKQRRVVIFGSAELRAVTYRTAGPSLFRWAAEHNLNVHDLGPPLQDPSLAGLLMSQGVTCHGRQSPNAISALLETSQYGVLAYHLEYVAKSGVLAAYCAHGVVPVLVSEGSCEREGLIAGMNYLHGLPCSVIDEAVRSELALSAWSWYQPHRIRAHADAFITLLDMPNCPR